MAGLKLNHIYKVYPNGHKAVSDFTMEIQDKEFIVFVGPSGCGKSTTLRMIAGLEEITAGELRMGDEVVNSIEPKDRDIAMVFQSYALYPHMTVYDNMTFGLKVQKTPDIKRDKDGNPILDKDGKEIPCMRLYTKQEIDAKVQEAAKILGITEYLDRKPKNMSGGQRQRVALGRAIVREPKVFLLDEPLSNLDAKLRTSMRAEISKLHKKLQTTFIYVTHDQVEAMTMGTRIVVMKDGFVQQIDTPRNLYNYPINKFVAGFIGTPQMNFYNVTLKKDGNFVDVKFEGTSVCIKAPYEYFYKVDNQYLGGDRAVILGIRSEHISIEPDKYPYKAKCKISHVEELGVDTQIFADFNIEGDENIAESATGVTIKAPGGIFLESDSVIDVSLDMSKIHLFDIDGEFTIAPRIPEKVDMPVSVKSGVLNVCGYEQALPGAIALDDGEYTVSVPVDSVKFGGKIKAKIIGVENVNGKTLYALSLGEHILFAIGDDKEASVGEEVNITLDLKMLTFAGEKGIFEALPAQNILNGGLTKQKVSVDNDGKVSNDTAYMLNVCNTLFDCPFDKAVLLINGGGKTIWNKELEFRFTPYNVKIAEKGIEATVEEIVDYGSEKFAKCRVKNTNKEVNIENKKILFINKKVKTVTAKTEDAFVYVSVDDAFNEKNVHIMPDFENSVMVEKERGIILA